MNRINVIIGPSGTGKTTLGKFLRSKNIPEVVSHTTRKPRKGEVNGVDYYFVEKEEFDTIEKIECVCYSGNYYCVSKNEVDTKLAQYNTIYVVTDINGAKQLKKQYGDIVRIIFIKISTMRMAYRMYKRGDSFKKIIERVKYCISEREQKNSKYADYVIKNNDFEKAKKQLLEIILDK